MTTLENLQAKIAKLQAQAELIARNESSTVIAKIRGIMERYGLTTADIEAHLGGRKRGREPGVKVAAVKSIASAAKYRDPKTGATWTGHGRAPAWIASAKDRSRFLIVATGEVASKPKAAAAKGKLPPKYRNPKTGETWSGHARPPAWIKDVKDRGKFLIDGAAVSAVAALNKPKKLGAYVRGPQAPKFRDPKTGATWSGRGPAPAWLAGAKDRTKFLIAGTDKAAAEPKIAAGKKATPAKKSPPKKVVIKKPAARKPAVKKVVAKKAVASTVKTAEAPVPAAKADGALTSA
ncbi:H-NS family nucleoid-associated regulatory protein [Paraburkholderia phymatum]|uniref:H-NS family nucleoid-associated regulatory protein n=1 Tax=Paraburkholderia phymatum TaxID=148447 RepID=A0ACC6U3L2_9BURK